MIYLDETTVRANLPWPELVTAIEQALLQRGIAAPDRMSFDMESSVGETGKLLLMPCWDAETSLGMKTVCYRPDNDRFGLASHGANYILMNPRSGQVQAVLEAHELTARRTAAVSALAAGRLAHEDAKSLLVVGTGPVAHAVVGAYAALRPLERIEVFGRSQAKADDLVARLAGDGITAFACLDLPQAVADAQIVVTATSSEVPLIKGAWLSPGTHLSLIGSFTPAMREVDDAVLEHAGEVWVDTATALDESGDLVGPLASGALTRERVGGTLAQLLADQGTLARSDDAVTVFKSVGFAICDLAAAQLALRGVAVRKPDRAAAAASL